MTSNPYRDLCNTDFPWCTVRHLVGITIFTSHQDEVTYVAVCFSSREIWGCVSGGMLNSVAWRIDPDLQNLCSTGVICGLRNLKIKNVLSFETSVIISHSKWRSIPEGFYLPILCTTRTYYEKDFQVQTWIIFVCITHLIDKKSGDWNSSRGAASRSHRHYGIWWFVRTITHVSNADFATMYIEITTIQTVGPANSLHSIDSSSFHICVIIVLHKNTCHVWLFCFNWTNNISEHFLVLLRPAHFFDLIARITFGKA